MCVTAILIVKLGIFFPFYFSLYKSCSDLLGGGGGEYNLSRAITDSLTLKVIAFFAFLFRCLNNFSESLLGKQKYSYCTVEKGNISIFFFVSLLYFLPEWKKKKF